MAASPVAVLAIIGLYTAFFAIISSATAGEADSGSNEVSNGTAGALDTDCGRICGLGDVLRIIFDFVGFLFDALTFNIDGVPSYIRFPIAVMIGSALVWSAVSLIRGN